MALTIRQITDEQKQQAKDLTGKGAASAAVVACIDLAAKNSQLVEEQRETIKDLRERLRHLDSVQSKLANACDEALTIVRQRDWISS